MSSASRHQQRRHGVLASVGMALLFIGVPGCGDDASPGNANVNANANHQGGICGNAVVEDLEACDDGPENSDIVPDACRTNCTAARCGDGTIDSGEICDDGNTSSGDGCTDDCLSDETCGNGLVDSMAGESCDGTNLQGQSCQSLGYELGALGCAPACTVDTSGCHTCGNSVCEPLEDAQSCAADCGAVSVSCSAVHTCALRADGTAWCWGSAWMGNLGSGEFEDQATPGPVQDLEDAVLVASAANGTCATLEDGSAWCWGANTAGQLGDGAQHEDVGFGDCSPHPVQVSDLADVISISGGELHTCAVRQDGSTWCWGTNSAGQLGNLGTTSHDTPVRTAEIETAVAISARGYRTCALLLDGTVWCWGANRCGLLGGGSTSDNQLRPMLVLGLDQVTAVATGFSHTCALRADGTVWCWGSNESGALGDGQTHQSCDGWYADFSPNPVQVSGLAGVVALAVNHLTSCAVLDDGSAWCWGQGEHGELGTAAWSSPTPTQVVSTGLDQVKHISVGDTFACALHANGTIWCWGDNAFGQLGDGTLESRTLPQQVVGWP